MLLIDRIIELNEDKDVTSIKNVTINEPFFNGHFPDHPVMPGVLIIEAMAQTAAIFVMKTLGTESEGKLVYFMSIDGAKFRKPVVPGDTIHITATKAHSRGAVWRFDAVAKVDGHICAQATITAMIRD